MLLVQLASMNVFVPYDNYKILFFMKVYCCCEVFFKRHDVAFFDSSVLKEVRILYLHSSNTNVSK